MTLRGIILLGATSCSLLAQRFEVASVKPRDPSSPLGNGCSGGPGTKDPLHYRCASESIAGLAHTAYNVSLQDMDAPEWMGNAYNGYDIQAVLPEGSTQDTFRIMLQNLLTERFHMKWHRETRQSDGYVLTAPKPKFRPSSPGAKYSLRGSNLYKVDQSIRILARAITMQDFANLLAPILQKRVVNETDLEGAFDFDLEFVSPLATAPVDGPSVFAAFGDLGFSLKAGRRPVNVFVIDSADRIPTPD